MSYLTTSDFRAGAGLNEACTGLALTTTEAPDASLSSGISRLSSRLDNATQDHFETQGGITLTLDVPYESDRLYLPQRTTAVTLVRTQDPTGTLTTQTSTSYRLLSSLDSTGANLRTAVSSVDCLQIVPAPGNGLAVTLASSPWVWPVGPQTVLVTGTFGWTTTPFDIKRALALWVFFSFKPIRNDLRMAETVSVADSTIRFDSTGPSGIPEVDGILADYRRDVAQFVG